MLSLNEKITWARVYVEAVCQIGNGEVQAKEIAHVIESVVLGGSVVLKLSFVFEVEHSHVMVNHQFIMVMVIQ